MSGSNENQKWRVPEFYKGYLYFTIFSLLMVMMLNILIDPFDFYGVDIFEPYELNSYSTKLALFKALDTPPEILILGSSRVEKVDPALVEEITGKPCFNWGLTGADTQSMLAALKLAVEEFDAPVDTVILGVDPNVFCPYFKMNSQVLLAPAYSKYFLDYPIYTAVSGSMNKLLSMEQFKSSLMVIRRDAGFDDSLPYRDYLANGVVIYPYREAMVANETFNLDEFLDWHIPKWVETYGTAGFTELSDERKARWLEILETCSAHGIKFIVYATPNHPRLSMKIEELGAGPANDAGRAFLEETVIEYGGIFKDFTDIESFGGDPDNFYDGIHLQQNNIALMTRALLENEFREPYREGG